jgi:quinol monooxygenase YgiN
MLKVIAENFIKPDKAEAAAPLFRELIAATRKEEGCIEYRLFLDGEKPGSFVFVEEWASAEALDKHMKSEHFTRIIPQIGAFQAKAGQVLKLKEFQ